MMYKTKIAVSLLLSTILISTFAVITVESSSMHNPETVNASEINSEQNDPYVHSPSYLFMNNWKNSTVWVFTGVPDQYIDLYGSLTMKDMSSNGDKLPGYITIDDGNHSIYSSLTANNTIMVRQNYTTECIIYPPFADQFMVHQNSSVAFTDSLSIAGDYNYTITDSYIILNSTPSFKIFFDASSYNLMRTNSSLSLNLSFKSGTSYIDAGFGNISRLNYSQIMSIDNERVAAWLQNSSRIDLGEPFSQEYDISLLLVKDDQNPCDGEFVASPSSLYLYAWVRDGSFAAISMQDSGHIKSAIKYWNWMVSEQGNGSVNGTWSTRFNFWNGDPDLSWTNPEYDSVGTFLIGLADLFRITGNKTLMDRYLPAINRSLEWEEKEITSYGLLPQDYSIWEENYGYNFWTQAMDSLGLNETYRMYENLGISFPGLEHNATVLSKNIMKYFLQRDNTMFAEYLTPVIGDKQVPYLPIDVYDSSSILPVALGFINPNSSLAHQIVKSNEMNLTVCGGLARYYGDTYHYQGYPSDSSGPMPPWVITTMFEAYYDEAVGNNTGALGLLSWAVNHTQSGILPEAIDPKFGTPLPTTSPLTWSSAMYILVSLNYNKTQLPSRSISSDQIIIISAGVSAVLVAVAAAWKLKLRKKR